VSPVLERISQSDKSLATFPIRLKGISRTIMYRAYNVFSRDRIGVLASRLNRKQEGSPVSVLAGFSACP
jgi:hypothetical protein